MLEKGYNKVEIRIKKFIDTVLLGEMPMLFVIDTECGIMAIQRENQEPDVQSEMFDGNGRKVESAENCFYDIWVHKNFQINKYKFNFNAFVITGQEMYGKVLFVRKEQNG